MNTMTQKLLQAKVVDEAFVRGLPRREAERSAKNQAGPRIALVRRLAKVSGKPYDDLIRASKDFTFDEILSVTEVVEEYGWDLANLPSEFHRT